VKTTHILINSFPVIITHAPEENRFWQEDKIDIFNPPQNDSKNPLEQKEINIIIEYLYHEGFILDRRTKYKIIEE
jgi:hypothetical protein